MRTSRPFAEFARRPSGVAEWEDLLVRFELAPRIARTVLEDIPAERRDAAELGRTPCAHLAHLAAREQSLAEWLDAMQRGASLDVPDEQPASGDAAAQLQRFTRLRGRNSGAVQRRGLDVWDWCSPHPDGGTVSVFQVLSVAVRHDGRHIAGMRGAC